MADEDKDKKKKGKGLKFVLFIMSLVVGFGLGIVVASYKNFGTFEFDPSLIRDPVFLAIFALSVVVYFIYLLSTLMKTPEKDSKAKVEYKGGVSKYYKVEWMPLKELETNKKFKYHLFQDLDKTDDIGTPIRADFSDGKNLKVNMFPEMHTMVIGSTGSGKSTQIISPYIQIMSKLKSKPGLVMSDAKGEMYLKHYKHLKNMGYRVITFDMAEPFYSTCWNPLTRPYKMYHRAHNLNNEIVIHRAEDPRKTELHLADGEYNNEWFEFDGVAFASMDSVNRRVDSERQRLEAEAFAELKELAMALSPQKGGDDGIWTSGAKDFINGLLIAMLEDSLDPERTGMTEEKFNFYNVYHIASLRDNDPYNPFKTIGDYFKGRGNSTSAQLANQVISNAPETKQSYFGFISDALGPFADRGVCYATSKNEMQLENFTDQPTALFIKVPDQEKSRYAIAAIFISQFYKVLVDIANKNKPKLALKREVHFLIDEFANFPKIPDFETTIAVSRSRRIYWTLILQSYSQLSVRYGEGPAKILRENCNIHIYIKSTDPATREEFSKLCGNTTTEVQTISSSTNKGKDKDSSSSGTNTNISIDQRPLIWPDELDTLPEGTNIVKIIGENPIKAEFTRSYKVPVYNMDPLVEGYKEQGYLDYAKITFDVEARNRKVLNSDEGNGTGLPDLSF